MEPQRAVAVVLKNDRVLLIKRHLNGHDYAVLPGGGVEVGESAAEAALRELWEETTLTARVDRLLWTGDHDGRHASYFLMADVVGRPELSGGEAEANCPENSFELVWATPTEFEELNLYPAETRTRLVALLN